MASGRRITRRAFIGAAAGAAAGGAAISSMPGGPRLLNTLRSLAGGATSLEAQTFYFFSAEEVATAAAICSRIVPSTNPITGAPSPGATEAMAVVFIDRFLAAFELPSHVADNPAIYLNGNFSGRNPYPNNATGEPSSHFPPDEFLSPNGQAHFLGLTPLQALSWRSMLYGTSKAFSSAPGYVSKTWESQVTAGTIPGPPSAGLRTIYQQGVDAFDSYSKSTFGVPFAKASPEEQDVMLAAAGNIILSQPPLPTPPGAPAAAKTLFPYVVLNTFEGCYGMPEYRWMSGPDATALWKLIGYDGDTQPLGNSIYDENLHGPGEGPNAGFGDPAVFLPRGGYKEHRAVSYLDDEGDVLTELDIAPLSKALEDQGFAVDNFGGGA